MKRTNIFLHILFLSIIIIPGGCKDRDSVYSVQRKAEKKLIEEYIKRKNIKVLDAFPADNQFADNEFVRTESGLYFQLVDEGSGQDTIAYSDRVSLRYKRWQLDDLSYVDTTSNWTTDYSRNPIEFQYGISSDASCEAWQEAVGYMKRNNSHAKLIVESKLGFSDDENSVTPYAYEIKIKIQKN